MKNKNRIQLFIILTTIVLLAAMVSIYFSESLKKSNNEGENVLGESVNVQRNIAYTHNIAPNSVMVGMIYDFNLNLYLDTEANTSITVNSLPKWLNSDGSRVYGIPSADDLGNHKLEYEINIDGQITEYIVDILVYYDEE